MNSSHQYTKAYLNTLRKMSRPNSEGGSGEVSNNTSAINQNNTVEYSKQENTIRNFIDSQEHELNSTGYNMNGSRVYLASSQAFKRDSPDKFRNSSVKNTLERKRSSNSRCNTGDVDPLEKDKGFFCVNYRSRDRFTGVGGARKRALSSASVVSQIQKNNSSYTQENTSYSPIKQSTYHSILSKSFRSEPQDDRLLSELKMSGPRIFKQQTQQYRRKPLRLGEREPQWNLNDEEYAQKLKEMSMPKQPPQRQYTQNIIGGNKTMDLKDPTAQDFILRLSAPKKYVPWPKASQGSKIFKPNNNDDLEFLNKISLPRRMADHGHKQNFRYNFCNCTNGDDYADEGRNMQGTSNGFFKIQSFFYQNSKAQDNCLYYPKILN